MTDIDGDDTPWQSWARLMPPRRPRGDGRNAVRGRVAAQIGPLDDDERNRVADFVDAFEAKRSTPQIGARLTTIALTVLALKREHPEVWAT